jgi:hypothetical protein
MRKLFAAAAAFALGGSGYAADLAKGTPEVKSISALAFGPNGVLFIADQANAAIVAVETGDTTPAGKDNIDIAKIDEKLAGMMGTMAANVQIKDVKANPASGNVYLAVARQGAGGGAMVVKLARDGKMAEFPLKDVNHAVAALNGANDKTKQTSITSIGYVEGKVVVAGLSNEEFASTLRVIPYPFKEVDKGSSVEIFHGAHGKLETKSPIQTFTPIKIGAADYLLAAYTCTPLVRMPVSDLKPGTKVKGTTIAELGNRNKPLDMIVYTKDKQEWLLIANSARGVMKMPTEGISTAAGIEKQTGVAGVKYETIKELVGVMHLDRLDTDRALILVQAEDKSYSLKSIPLP